MKGEKVLLPVDVRRSKTSLLKLSNCKGNADSGNEIAGDCIFPEKYTVKDHISNTKLEKAIIITSKHGTRIFFPITILF